MHARSAGPLVLRALSELAVLACDGASFNRQAGCSVLQLALAPLRPATWSGNGSTGGTRVPFSTASYEELRNYLQSLKQGAAPISAAHAQELQRDIETTYLQPQQDHGDPTAAAATPAQAGSTAQLAGAATRRPQRRPSIEPHHLAEAVWAFATMKHHHDELFQEVAKYAVRTNLLLLPPASAARFIWAYAELRVYDARLFAELAAVCIKKAREFTARQLADVIWAFASMQHRDAELYRTLGKAAFRQLYSFQPHGLARIAWAFSQVGHYHEAFHTTAVAQLSAALHKLRPAEVAQFATALSVFGPVGHDAFDVIAAAAVRGVAQYPQGTWQQLVDAFKAVQHERAHELASLASSASATSTS